MDVKRILRALVCFVVVFALMVQISPIQVRALDPLLVSAGIVVGSILLGLGFGIGVDATNDILTPFVNDCVDNISDKFCQAIDGAQYIPLYEVERGGEGSIFYAAQELVEAVRAWLFDSGTVVEKAVSVDSGRWLYNTLSCPPLPDSASDYSAAFIYLSGYYYLVLCSGINSTSPVYDAGDFSNTNISFNGPYITYYCKYPYSTWVTNLSEDSSGVFTIENKSLRWSSVDISGLRGNPVYPGSVPIKESYTDVSVPTGIVLSEFASSDEDLPTGYPLWTSNVISIPGATSEDEDVVAYPVGIGQTLDDTLGLTQSDVWAGSSTYVDSSTDTDTGTDTSTEVGLLEGIWNSIKSLPKSIADAFSDVISFVKSWPQTIADWFEKVISAIDALVDSLAQAITDVLAAVFIPAEGYVDAKVSALTDKYVFADSIAQTGMDLKHFLVNLGAKPPIIYIDLGAFTGDHSYGGRVKFLDLTWYSQYKDTMDVILSAILWLWFAWRMMLALPGIIQGTSGFWSKLENLQETQALVIAKDWYERR